MEHRKIARVRTQLIKESSVYCKSDELSCAERAAEFARSLYYEFAENEVRCMPKECMIVCCVDTKCKPTIIEHVSVGTANSALVDVKSIFMSAILSNSDGIFVFHNHPSGSAEPSAQDNLITNKIREAGNLLDIKLLDHIIVGDSEYYSYDEKRLCAWREQYEKVS
jgi:DNA repair protein RadC